MSNGLIHWDSRKVNQMNNEKLIELVVNLASINKEEQEIIARSDGTVGGIEKIGETKHLDNLEKSFEDLWNQCLPLAAEAVKNKKIKRIELKAAYAMFGMVTSHQMGAVHVAEAIAAGKTRENDHYFPPQHSAGMVSALQYVLAHE